jgi:hypothetical protein
MVFIAESLLQSPRILADRFDAQIFLFACVSVAHNKINLAIDLDAARTPGTRAGQIIDD